MIEVENHRVTTYMGKSDDWYKIAKIKKKDADVLNEVGYSGQIKGVPMTVSQYLDSMSGNKMKFTLVSLEKQYDTYMEEFLLIIVTLK